jgi:hypothetical protein
MRVAEGSQVVGVARAEAEEDEEVILEPEAETEDGNESRNEE